MSFFDLLPITVSCVGGYLLFKLKAFFVLRPHAVFRELYTALRTRGAVGSLCLALAGTLGVGNIVGVAVGLIVGGAGSVFWLLFSSLFAAVLKYSEGCISSDISGGQGGGMITALKASFLHIGGGLSGIYAALSVVLAMSMGGALQTVGAAGAMSSVIEIDVRITCIIFALSVGLIVLFFNKKPYK